MDNKNTLANSMRQYERLKPFCKSILRVVTCDFNKANPEGYKLALIQDEIIQGKQYIDTVFRPSKKNQLITNGIINVKKKRFLKSKQLVSKLNKKTYLGKCENCKEMCGANMETKH
jgi:hypothetical protein